MLYKCAITVTNPSVTLKCVVLCRHILQMSLECAFIAEHNCMSIRQDRTITEPLLCPIITASHVSGIPGQGSVITTGHSQWDPHTQIEHITHTWNETPELRSLYT